MHAGNRCWQIMTSRPRRTVNQPTVWTRKIQRKAFLIWLKPFTVNLEDLDRCARTFFWKSELRFGRWRFKSGDFKKRKHSVHAYFRKNQKRSILRTETVEHKCESRNKHRYAVVVQVLATQWNPCQTNTSQETEKNLPKFLQPSQKPKVIYTDNSL